MDITQGVPAQAAEPTAIKLDDVAYDITQYLNGASASGSDRAYSVGSARHVLGGSLLLEGSATDIDTMQSVPFVVEIRRRAVQS